MAHKHLLYRSEARERCCAGRPPSLLLTEVMTEVPEPKHDTPALDAA
jgi:hypothetical protein